jgi:hypothetical protein
VKHDEARKLCVVGWSERQVEHEDEPWSKKGLRSGKLG